jgi:conjugative relaxase-like TrwC/TraI family protein
MMTLSKALAAGQAKEYFEAEYTNSQESYYSEAETVKGKWFGKQAEAWELQGDVDPEHFERLCEGQHPLNGDQLVRHVTAHKYENAYGEVVETSEHRAGWDATFSAPKSVSLAGLVGCDERILEAHDRSVNVALQQLEKYAQARMGGNQPAQTTGKIIAAKFQHDSARPDRITGYAAPQLHTHVVVFNITETEDGRIKPIQPLELYRSQRFATAIYRAVLATELRKLGYEIGLDGRTGAPEISGFSKEYLAASSPRSAEIQREAAQMKERLAKQGIQVDDGAGLRQAAAKTDRVGKQFDRSEMRARHLAMDADFGEPAARVVQRAQERRLLIVDDQETSSRAREAVAFARESASEHEAVVDQRHVVVDALRRNLGLTTYEAVMDELNKRIEMGEFIRVTGTASIEKLTTSQTVAMEQSNIRTLVGGKRTQIAICGAEAPGALMDEITAKQGIKLNQTQLKAVEMILQTSDRIVGLEGRAGTGKTTTLSVLRDAVERSGYQIAGFAPTGAAADLLSESGIRTCTLQKFASSNQLESDPERKILYVLDESSLSDTKNMFLLLKKAGPSARLLLVGDTGQHQAVDAGAPFEQFVEAGMTTATLDEIVRQQSDLRKPVEQLARRDVIGAVKTLFDQGRVTEIADDEDRLTAIATDYVSNPRRTLVISPANQERVAINSIIHRQLQDQGLVSPTDHQTTVLVNRQDMTGSERKFALAYISNEDVIRYNTGSKVFGINKGDYGRVLDANHRDNKLTVQLEDGREITYNPKRLAGVSVYKQAERQFAVGDRIQFRAPFADVNVKNTELGTITDIAQGEFTVSLGPDRIVTFDPKRFPHLDHGYAVTSYSSQGKTMDRVLVNAETTETDLLVNQRMAYVAVSRARLDARIYTDSAVDLSAALARRKDKTMALEALQQAGSSVTDDRGFRNDLSAHAMRHEGMVSTNTDAQGDEGSTIARLKARAILGDSDVAVAHKRLSDFEKTKHLYSFEIDGEQWSLVRVDRQQRVKERQIDYNKRTISAYRMRLYGAINNPLKLYGLRDYRENARRARDQIKGTRVQLDDLRQIRETVTSCIQDRREGLQTELRTKTESVEKLKDTFELKPDLHAESGKETPQPEFNEKELDRLEANARLLRDPNMLQTAHRYLQQHYQRTGLGIAKLAARANTWLTNINDHIRTFTENREFVPLLFKPTNGQEQTATVRELANQTAGRNVLSRVFSDSDSQLDAVKQAVNERNKDLSHERSALQEFVKAAVEIADQYGQMLEGRLSIAKAPTVNHEYSEATLGHVGPHSSAMAVHAESSIVNDPLTGHELKDMTKTLQENYEDHLKQIRQTIDRISLMNGATNETGIKAGVAEAETAASESLAALI